MNMPHRLVRDRADTLLLAFAPFPTGLVVALFSDRFTSRSWRFAGGIPGGYPLWSGVLLICGVVMLLSLIGKGKRRDAMLLMGMSLAGAWWFILGAMFLYTAIVDRLANPLGVVAWWMIAGFYGIWVRYQWRQ